MEKEQVPPPPPPLPPFGGIRRSHNQSSKNMDSEQVPPPPPPPPPRGTRQSLNQSSKKMDKAQVPPPPPARLQSSDLLSLSQISTRKVPPPPRPRHPPGRYSSSLPLRYHYQDTEMAICLLAHPTLPHTLYHKYRKNANSTCFSCGEHISLKNDSTFHHHCDRCDVEFHRGCHKFPRKTTHPYHPQHPLTFTFRNYQTGIISDGNIDDSFWNTIMSEANTSDSEKPESVEISQSQSDVVLDKCTWCGGSIEGRWFYRCSICNFCLDLSCFQNNPLLFVANPKSHHHSLAFYPRPLLTPCDACGFVSALEPSYSCFQCNYMVHQSCIDLPRVIKITRHQHRLSHTPYLQSIVPPCRVCYKTVDNKYGQYSCNHDGCSYIVHSKCATHEKIWDGKELEWEPEEPDQSEDIAPFKKVGNGMIKHFSHDHLLKLEKFCGVRDAEKQCQACILPIESRDFYSCVQCDYFLHEVCACLLRKLDHALHVHPLVLDPSPKTQYNHNGCSVCSRKSAGFRYKCSIENCVLQTQIDVRCILVPDYFTHKGHEHPLFLSSPSYNSRNKICCKGCKKICLESYLQCTVCKFAMCYHCATIPTEVSYKYDKHPLSLCHGEEEVDGMYWCEVCEKEVNPTDWFYTCNQCCITIHLQCVFGEYVYMKPGFKFKYHIMLYLSNLEVIRNSISTRPLCNNCGLRCPSSVYYKNLDGRVSCSMSCIEKRKVWLEK